MIPIKTPRRRSDISKPIRSLIKQSLLACCLFSGLTVASAGAELTTEKLADGFANPSGAYRPWVMAFWLHGNVDRASITRELEAMKRVGLGGLMMFDVAQPGIPAGEHGYMQPSWQEMFGFEIAEAKRLGLEVMTNLGPGYCNTNRQVRAQNPNHAVLGLRSQLCQTWTAADCCRTSPFLTNC